MRFAWKIKLGGKKIMELEKWITKKDAQIFYLQFFLGMSVSITAISLIVLMTLVDQQYDALLMLRR